MQYQSSKAVVTGGVGFIGSHLVDQLLRDGYRHVVVLDNLARGRPENLVHHRRDARLELVTGDVRDAACVAAVLRGAHLVFHLAAQATVMGAVEDPDYTFTTNVVGTYNVLRAASRYSVGRVVFTSSREVYGEPIALPVDEASPLQAINSYGASKVAGEAFCRAFRHQTGLQVAILRLANVYGPRDTGRVIPTWIAQAAAGRDLDVYGGHQVLDLVWIELVVKALIRAATVDGPLPPINVGSGTGTPIMALARRIVALTGGTRQIRILQARRMEVGRFVANVDRMRQFLTVEPPFDPLSHLPSLVQTPGSPAGAAAAHA